MTKDEQQILEKRHLGHQVLYYPNPKSKQINIKYTEIPLLEKQNISYLYPKKEKQTLEETENSSILPIPEIYL